VENDCALLRGSDASFVVDASFSASDASSVVNALLLSVSDVGFVVDAFVNDNSVIDTGNL
jgi:hypothetical protein